MGMSIWMLWIMPCVYDGIQSVLACLKYYFRESWQTEFPLTFFFFSRFECAPTAQLQNKADIGLITKLVWGFSECVVKIAGNADHYEALLAAIWLIDVPRTKLGIQLGTALSKFMSHIVSCNNGYLVPCLDTLVRHFKPCVEISDEGVCVCVHWMLRHWS